MERIKVNNNFYLDEFVDPYTYFYELDRGFSLIDERLFDIVQFMRYLKMGPISINNWWKYYSQNEDKYSTDYIIKKIEESNKLHKWSGLRTDRCKIGAPMSAHRTFSDNICKAIDPKGNEIEMYNILKSHAKEFYKLGVRRVEDISITKGWLHIDTLEKNVFSNSIKVVGRTNTVGYIKF